MNSTVDNFHSLFYTSNKNFLENLCETFSLEELHRQDEPWSNIQENRVGNQLALWLWTSHFTTLASGASLLK